MPVSHGDSLKLLGSWGNFLVTVQNGKNNEEGMVGKLLQVTNGKKGAMLTPFYVRGEQRQTMTWSEVVGLCACQCEDLTMRGRCPNGLEVFT